MTAARLGYRNNQRETIKQLTTELEALREENNRLKALLAEHGLEGE